VPGQGRSVISATATDAAGNEGPTFSRNVIVDTAGPQQRVEIRDVRDNVGDDTGSVDDGDETDDTRPQLIIRLSSDPLAGDELQIFENGALLGTVNANDDNISYTTPFLRDGEYEFQARLVDASGNAGALSDAYTITIDTTP